MDVNYFRIGNINLKSKIPNIDIVPVRLVLGKMHINFMLWAKLLSYYFNKSLFSDGNVG